MRKLYSIILVTASALLLSSCVKDPAAIADDNDGTVIEDGVRFTATYALPEAPRSTFTSGVLGWEAGDCIAICDGTNVATVTLAAGDITGGGATASFTVTGIDPAAAAYYAVYPASVAAATAGEFVSGGEIRLLNAGVAQDGKNSFWSVAKTTTTALSFKNAGALIVIETTNPAISYLTFDGDNREVLASNPTVNPDDGTLTAGSGTARQIRSALEGGKAYICFEPQTMMNGFVIRCYDSGDNYLGFYDSFKYDSDSFRRSLAFERNHYYPVSSFDTDFVAKAATLPGFVDLGLPSGLQWAGANIGTTDPATAGTFFAWGEINPKPTAYYFYGIRSDETPYVYPYRHGTNNASLSANKYGSGTLATLEAIDDAATMNYGPGYKMPTYDDFVELRANTLCVQIDGSTATYNGNTGVAGVLLYKAKESEGQKDTYSSYTGLQADGSVTGSKTGLTYSVSSDAHIFLPVRGYMQKAAVNSPAKYGYYPSSTYFGKTGDKEPYTDNVSGIHVLRLAVSGTKVSPNHNVGMIGYWGYSVRAVKVVD